MTRREELEQIIGSVDSDQKTIVGNLLDDVIFIEDQLANLRKLPLIRINPKNPAEQKPTTSAKLYKELLQQYQNALKILLKLTGASMDGEESPLREYMRKVLG